MCELIKKLFVKPAADVVDVEVLLPTSTLEISTDEKEKFLKVKFPNVEVFITYNHLLANYNDIALFLIQDQTNKFPYSFPDYICSNFAMRLAGQFNIPKWSEVTFGLVWTNTHALNCVLTEDLKFFFVEPQTDELIEDLKLGQGGFLRFIML